MEAGTSLANPFESRPRKVDRLPGQPALLWVGRLNRNKDPLTVLEGFSLALRSQPRAALTLVFHEDLLLAEVHAFLQGRPDVARRVHVLGRVSRKDLEAMYAGADLFVLGSHHEGSGFALIEALASGVVPVVTDIPTFRVLTGNGTLGALWTPGDARAFAAALGEVGARDLRPLRTAISSHVRKELTWEQIGHRAIDAYGAALSTAGGGYETAVA